MIRVSVRNEDTRVTFHASSCHGIENHSSIVGIYDDTAEPADSIFYHSSFHFQIQFRISAQSSNAPRLPASYQVLLRHDEHAFAGKFLKHMEKCWSG
jgi:hypothetical protein